MMGKPFPKNTATVHLLPFVVLGIAIAEPDTKLSLSPSTLPDSLKAITKTFLLVFSSIHLDQGLGDVRLGYWYCPMAAC